MCAWNDAVGFRMDATEAAKAREKWSVSDALGEAAQGMSLGREAEEHKQQYGQQPSWKLQCLMLWSFAVKLKMRELHTNHSTPGGSHRAALAWREENGYCNLSGLSKTTVGFENFFKKIVFFKVIIRILFLKCQ